VYQKHVDTRRARDALRRQRELLERAERELTAIEASQATLREKEEAWLSVAADLIMANPGPAIRRRLRRREQQGNVNSSTVEMAPAHRIALSKASKSKGPFLDAVRAKGYTLRGLADAVGCLPSLLSMYRNSDEPRPIPRDRAEAIEKLIGWPANAKHWPGGIT